MIPEYDAVVFDMDGVIFDSERARLACWHKLAARYGLPPETLDGNYRPCIGVTKARAAEVLREAYGIAFSAEAFLEDAFSLYHQDYSGENLPLKSGVREILSFLKEQNKKIALASSSDADTIRRNLSDAGIYEAFDAIVSGEMVEKSKPAPDIFLKACEVLAVNPSRTYAIEDSHNGVRSAYAGGLRPIMVPDLLPPTEEMAAIAETVCDTLSDAKDYLKNSVVILSKNNSKSGT